jgi:hypothetical protein
MRIIKEIMRILRERGLGMRRGPDEPLWSGDVLRDLLDFCGINHHLNTPDCIGRFEFLEMQFVVVEALQRKSKQSSWICRGAEARVVARTQKPGISSIVRRPDVKLSNNRILQPRK